MMLVCYSFAHSDPRGSPGATSLSLVTERQVAREAFIGFETRCKAEGYEVKSFAGRLEANIRAMNKALWKAKKADQKWVSIELHFNMPPEERCGCGKMKYAGVPCPSCGAPPSSTWTWGHTAMVYRHSFSSVELATRVLDHISTVMPWSRRRHLILLPDERYGKKAWPRIVYRPAVLVEAGFGIDPKFSQFIAERKNQQALGWAIAEAICEWADKRKDVPLNRWAE